MVSNRTLTRLAVLAAAALPAALAGCKPQPAAKAPTTAPSAGGPTADGGTTADPKSGASGPMTGPSVAPPPGWPAVPTTLPTMPAIGGGSGTNGLPPLPKITPGTLPALPPMISSTTRPFTRPAFPSTQEYNK